MLTSVGCGSGNFTPPLSSVGATSNPLVAQYSINHSKQGMSAWVEFGTDTTYGRQTSVKTTSLSTSGGQTLNILVAGMKPQTTYHMRAHVTTLGGPWVDDDHTFTTGALPTSLAAPQISVGFPVATAVAAGPAPGVELLSLTSTNGESLQAVATDLQGNVIWYCPGGALPIKQLPNGDYIINNGENLAEVDLICKTVRGVSLQQVGQSLQAQGYSFNLLYFSHDVLVLPSGHWIGLIQISQNFTDLPGYPGTLAVLGDLLVDIDPDGNVVWHWSAFDYLDINRHLFGLPDWTHSNALVYTPEGNLLLSMRNQSWILKINYANGNGSGNVLWKLGEGGDFTVMGGDSGDWFYGQHDPNIVSSSGSQTTLAVFDDGDLRIDSDGVACGSAPPCYTRATIFQIDEGTYLATLLWEYTPELYTPWGGSIGVLSNNDVEFAMSSPFPSRPAASQIMEVTQTSDPQTVWQMVITGTNAYRGIRIPSLYPGVTWTQ
jgi:arylsulfate sulfotransferase